MLSGWSYFTTSSQRGRGLGLRVSMSDRAQLLQRDRDEMHQGLLEVVLLKTK